MSAIEVDKIQQWHTSSSRKQGENVPPLARDATTDRARSSVVYKRAVWFATRDFPILRAAYFCGLTLAVFLHFTAAALTLLVLGQFVEIAVAWRRLRRGRRLF